MPALSRKGFSPLILALLIGTTLARTTTQTVADETLATTAEYHPSRILIQPKAGVDPNQLDQFHQGIGAQMLRRFPQIGQIQVLHLDTNSSVQESITRYAASGLVQFAEPDYRLRLATEPNDPRYLDGSLWHLHNTGQNGGVAGADIDAPEAWATLRDATNIIVAIVDTGIRYTHQDLAANMWVNPGEIADGKDTDGNGYIDDLHGINAAGNNGNPIDLIGHGTQVAGLTGAVGNNAKGGTGVAWSVQLMALRFFDDSGNGYVSDAVKCFDYARVNGAHLINASFGGPSYSSSLYSAIQSCRNAGIIVVAAAGNEGQNTDSNPFYPASYNLDNIVAVTATTRTDALASYSNYGPTTVDLGAPGSDLYTTYNSSDSSYVRNSGTSFAAPVTAGAFALLKARYPTDSHLQLIERVLTTVDPLPSLSGQTVTGGRLNLASALGPPLQAGFTVNALAGELPLTVEFTDQSFGAVVSWMWDFGDGTTSTTANPTHTFTQAGEFVVRLTVADGEEQTSEATALIQAVANYKMQPAPFQWVDPSGMPSLSLTVNGVSPAQSLPFPFHYYGQNYNTVYVSANGMVGFVPDGLNQSSNVDLPNSAWPNAMLCPWWDDLDPGSSGSVHVGVTGSAPNRQYVISWAGVPHRNPGRKASFTFQAVLEEATQAIVFQYLNVDASHSLGAGRSATVGVENQTGTVAARYSYNGSTLLQNQQAIAFVPALVPALSVTPTTAFNSTGPAGGPFSPNTQTFTLSNSGGTAIDWSAEKTVDWLSLSAIAGSLAPGASVTVTVSLNTAAHDLAAGSHNDVVSFFNNSHGDGHTTRPVSLTVDPPPGILTVTPPDGLSSTGYVGGPFSPDTQTFTLSNSGGTAIDWSAEKTVDWLSLSAIAGSLAPGASVTVTVSLNTATHDLAAGSHNDVVSFFNNSHGDGHATRPVSLTVDPPPGGLRLVAAVAFQAKGFTGGPFAPNQATYDLVNNSSTPVEWSATCTVDWVAASPSSGTIAPGEQVSVTLQIRTVAEDLAEGVHQGSTRFTSSSDPTESLDIPVVLEVFRRAWLFVETHNEKPESLSITVNGHPGHQYGVEVSENLNLWAPVHTDILDSTGVFHYRHPNEPTTGFRAFRVVWIP